jgi:signal transduction histidine kinase
MSLFAWAGLSLSVLCLILALVILKYAENATHRVWGILNLFVALWGGGTYLAGISTTSSQAIFYWKLAHIPAIFIAVLFYHLIHSFCNLKGKLLLLLIYLQGIAFFLAVSFTNQFINSATIVFGNIQYFEATPLYSVFLAIWCVIALIAFISLFNFIKTNEGATKIQALFLFWAMLPGFLGGLTTVLPAYNILSIYPAWHFSICVYAFIVTYALLRHNFLGIQVNAKLFLIPAILLILSLGVFVVVHFHPTWFALAGLSLGVSCLFLAFIVLAYSKQKVHRLWALFNTVVALWGLGTCLAGLSDNSLQAIQSWRITYLPCTFIAIVFYHLICTFCNINRKKMIIFTYVQGVLFLPFIYFSPYFVNSTFFLFNSIHYHVATPLFELWMAIFVSIAGAAFVELVLFIRNSRGIKKTQALYLFWGMALGWAGGLTTLLPPYNLNIVYPAYHFTICIYAFMMTYAIFRYEIMDIKIAVTRLGILVLVYSIVLGIPFGLEALGKNWLKNTFGLFGEWIPMLTLLGFATAGPFIFLFLQRKTEEKMLQEEQRINNLLTQASYGMNNIHNLEKLLSLIIDVLIKILRINNSSIFLLNKTADKYNLKASQPENAESSVIYLDNELIKKLKAKKFPIIYEEARIQSEMEGQDASWKNAAIQMKHLSASIVVPIMMNTTLLGFFTLGERKSKEMYSKELLNALIVLGNQSALAIENCNFWEAETKRMEEEGLEERRLALDHVASSMAHEIDNPMGVISGQVETLQILFKNSGIEMPDDMRQRLNKSFDFILEASSRVTGMIRAIQEYSKKSTGELKPIKIQEVEDGFWRLMGHAYKDPSIKFIKQIDNELPYILGDKIQLEEILVNFSNNALHAVRNSKEKKIMLRIYKKDENMIRIEFSDTGYGIPDEIISDIFLASVTTKGSVEGTGLGLFRVRKIVDLHNGKVWAESEGKDKGSKFIVEIPVFKGNAKEFLDKNEESSKGPRKMF